MNLHKLNEIMLDLRKNHRKHIVQFEEFLDIIFFA